MAEKAGTTIIVEHTAPEACEVCGNVSELRPYGPGGKKICVFCGMKDSERTHARMMEILARQMEGVTHVVLGEDVIGDRGVVLRRGHLDEDIMASMAGPRDVGVSR